MAKPIDWEREIEVILLEYGNRVLDVQNGKENPTFGELLKPPTTQLKELLDKARLSEAEWWNSNIDFVAWEKRLTQLKDQLNAKGEKK